MTVMLDRALALAADRLDGVATEAEVRRAELVARHDGPLGLACELNRRLERTAALKLLSEALEQAITHPGTRLIISVPPQEGKTTLVRHAVLRKLQRDPDLRNAIASYAVDLARTSGRAIRHLIDANGSAAVDPASGHQLTDRLGITVRGDHAAAGDWALAEHDGGVYAIGVGGGLTGRPVDGMFVVDDPVKDQQQADSEVMRERVWEWFTAVGETRLGPETSVVVIMTRWHEDDLAGRLIARDAELPEDEREWRVINIPALADGVTADALADVPGARDEHGWLISARRRTAALWAKIRRRVGERVFGSLYQGRPSPLDGGIFKREWVENHRATQLPGDVDQTVVAVDPAETGMGDAAGILVGHRNRAGHFYVTTDLSGQLTQAQWGRRVCLAVLRTGAASIVQERNLGMSRVLPDAWQVIRRQAVALRKAAGDIPAAGALLQDAGDTVSSKAAELAEVAPIVDDVLSRPANRPCRIAMIHPRVSKQARAEGITHYYELGEAHHVGTLPLLEHEMFTWQPGQDSPNRLDTLALLLAQLDTYSAQKGRRAQTGTGRTRAQVPSSTPSVFRPGFR